MQSLNICIVAGATDSPSIEDELNNDADLKRARKDYESLGKTTSCDLEEELAKDQLDFDTRSAGHQLEFDTRSAGHLNRFQQAQAERLRIHESNKCKKVVALELVRSKEKEAGSPQGSDLRSRNALKGRILKLESNAKKLFFGSSPEEFVISAEERAQLSLPTSNSDLLGSPLSPKLNSGGKLFTFPSFPPNRQHIQYLLFSR